MANGFLFIFALFYFAEHAVGLWLTSLNLRYLQLHAQSVPSYFQDKISLPDYQKSIRYIRDKTHLGIVSSLAEIPIFWGMLLSGFFGLVDLWARSLGLSPVLSGLVFLSVMGVLSYLLALPFRLFSTFVIEKRYGFNRTTLRTWLLDTLKGLLLTMGIGGPLLIAVLWLMNRYMSGFWWIYAWGVLALFQFSVMALFPVLIVPLFNKLTPLPEGNLRERIEALACKIGFQMSGIFTMDGSKRSLHSNAFFAGIGRFRRIVLFDTLVGGLNEPQLLAVLAHEMGHNVKKHVRASLVVGLGSSLAGLYVLSQLLKSPWFYSAFGFPVPSSHAALFIFAKASGAFTFFLEPVFSMLSRKHEYEADRFAADTLGDEQPMIESLVKLSKDNLSNLTPHPLYSFFYYSHPTPMERIQALERLPHLERGARDADQHWSSPNRGN